MAGIASAGEEDIEPAMAVIGREDDLLDLEPGGRIGPPLIWAKPRPRGKGSRNEQGEQEETGERALHDADGSGNERRMQTKTGGPENRPARGKDKGA